MKGRVNRLLPLACGMPACSAVADFRPAVVAKDEPFFLCPNAVNAIPAVDKARNLIDTIAQDGKHHPFGWWRSL